MREAIAQIRPNVLYLVFLSCITVVGLHELGVVISSDVYAVFQLGLGGVVTALYGAESQNPRSFKITAALVAFLGFATMACAEWRGMNLSSEVVSGYVAILLSGTTAVLALDGISVKKR